MARRINTDRLEQLGTLVTTETSRVINVSNAAVFSVQAVLDVNTPSAKAFATTDVDVDEDTITEAGHGFTTGLKGQASSTGTLPDGLATTTDYFVIVVDADTYQLAASLSDALAGTEIDIVDQGSGTHTFTPTALAGGNIKLQKSNFPASTVFHPDYEYDSAHWTDVAAATAVTADATVWFEAADPAYRAAIVHITLTAGSVSADLHIVTKED